MQQQRSQKTPPLFTGNRLQLEPATTSVSDLMSRLHCYLPGEELDEHWQSSATPYNTSTKVGGSDTAVPLKSAAPDLRERLPGTGPGPRVLPAVKLILQTSIPDGAVAHLTDAARICHRSDLPHGRQMKQNGQKTAKGPPTARHDGGSAPDALEHR
ncbi:hypothetical protein GN956_G5839 [Arapaima gigas]